MRVRVRVLFLGTTSYFRSGDLIRVGHKKCARWETGPIECRSESGTKSPCKIEQRVRIPSRLARARYPCRSPVQNHTMRTATSGYNTSSSFIKAAPTLRALAWLNRRTDSLAPLLNVQYVQLSYSPTWLPCYRSPHVRLSVRLSVCRPRILASLCMVLICWPLLPSVSA